MSNQEFIGAVTAAWKEVFVNSHISAKPFIFGGDGAVVTGLLSGSIDECTHKVIHNDPLNYVGFYEDGAYKEDVVSVFVRPAPGSHLALDTVKLRKVTIKDPTHDKLVKRFTQLRNMLIDNVDRIYAPEMNVPSKLGL